MKSKQICLPLIVLLLLVNGCLISFASSQDQTPQTLTVTLNGPADGSTITTYDCTFVYIPSINGSDYFVDAKLTINGTVTAVTNQTAIANATENTIAYKFASNGTYLWNVQVQNSTNNLVAAPADFTLKVAVYEQPEATPTPAPSPTPTPTPSPTPEPTPVPTPTPTPTVTPQPTAEPFAVDSSLIIIIVLLVLAIILAVVIVFLWKESR